MSTRRSARTARKPAPRVGLALAGGGPLGAIYELGAPGFDHVPISQAVLASTALPGLFPPVEIDGRFYVDGALKKTRAEL